ncbi:MAG: hypothetical protein AAGF12_33440 [Myxococcota bacterium]
MFPGSKHGAPGLLGAALMVAAALMAAFGGPVAAQSHTVPSAVRGDFDGCWIPWPGERWVIQKHGPTGLMVHRVVIPTELRHFRSREHRRRRSRSVAYWNARAGALEIDCGPRTQHGQFCLVQPVGDALRVFVYARRHNPRENPPRFTAEYAARRCSG